MKNSKWTDLRDFAFKDIKQPETSKKWNQPFPHSVPDFPVRQQLKRDRTSLLEESKNKSTKGNTNSNNGTITNNNGLLPFIPPHCPPLPAQHTLKSTAATTQSTMIAGQLSSKKMAAGNTKLDRNKKINAVKKIQEGLAVIEAAGDAQQLSKTNTTKESD